jgi:peptide/nickel transport system ATP-binding protein
MTQPLLSVNSLKTWIGDHQHPLRAVDGVSFDIERGETFAILGESGCGKSMLALSIMRLNPSEVSQIVEGDVSFSGESLFSITESDMQSTRGRKIAMIFQEPQSSLNPVMTVGEQIAESLDCHFELSSQEKYERIVTLLHDVGIPDPHQRIAEFPHQLSGGMKQRVMIAIALAGEPALLIADEPTTALDVTIQAQILSLLKSIQKKRQMSILLISHDLAVVANMADRIAVMYAGQFVEIASRERLFSSYKHPYTQKLFQALPTERKREQRLTSIRGTVPVLTTVFQGCRFEQRCDYANEKCRQVIPQWQMKAAHGVACHLYESGITNQSPLSNDSSSPLSDVVPTSTPILKVDNLAVHFPIKKGVFKRQVGNVKAVDGVSLLLNRSETLALVGESGCGKTTVGRGILRLVPVTQGSIHFHQTELSRLSSKKLNAYRSALQVIFQDPFSSMNPRMTVSQIIEEAISNQSQENKEGRVDALLTRVGLQPEIKHRYPHEFSGGQRQRICIARALATEPEVIICDEPTSALDVSVQAQILNLLRDLQHEFGLSYLFITHNIAVVDYLAHRVAVMYLGRIVEQGTREQVMTSPKHPYTQALLSAVPSIESPHTTDMIKLEGELPSPANPPQGCHFHQRCPQVMQRCQSDYPSTITYNDGHQVNCFLYQEE